MKKILICMLGVMLALCGVLLSACSKTYDDMRILSNAPQGEISLSVGETKEIVFSVVDMPKGASGKLSLTPSSNIISASIKNYDNETGKSVVEITGLSHGNCSLRAQTLEAGKYLDIEVKVSLAVEDFNLKDDINLFAVRGTNNPKNLVLNSDMFSFSPTNTSQKEIKFFDADGNEIFEINPNETSLNEIDIVAKSPYLDKEVSLKIKIIEEIESVDIFDKLNQNQLFSKEQENYQDIMFISNRKELSRKDLSLRVKSGDNSKIKVVRSVIQNSVVLCSDFDVTSDESVDSIRQFNFELQSLNTGKTTIEFKVFYVGFEDYVITRTFDLVVNEAPNQIKLNDTTNPSKQILFAGAYSTVVSTQYISVFPSNAVFDKIEMEFFMPTDLSGNVEDYINFTMSGLPIEKTIENFDSPIVAKGIKDTNGLAITLKLTLTWGENIGIENNESKEIFIEYVVKSGASSILLENEADYFDGIYVYLEDGKVDFEKFYVDNENAYTNDSQIYCISQTGGNSVSLSQNQSFVENQKKYLPISITPKSEGTSTWRIVLPNGVLRDFKIKVIKKLDNLTLDVGGSNFITSKQYSVNGSLNMFNVKLQKFEDKFTFGAKLELKTSPIDYSLNESLYELKIEANKNITYNAITKEFSLLCDEKGYEGEIFSYEINIFEIEDFKLVKSKKSITGEIEVLAYVPLESISFSKSEISLYSANELGYYYKQKSQSETEIVANPSNISIKDNPAVKEIILSSSIDEHKISFSGTNWEGKVLEIENLGTYNFETSVFELNKSGAMSNLLDPFFIYASVKYYDDYYLASLKINPLEYVNVTNVRLSSFTNEIYLSSSKNFVDIYTYVTPNNATDQDLIYSFEGKSNLVKLEKMEVGSGVRVLYNGEAGTGTLVIVPRSSVKNVSENPDNSLRIPITVGDGTKENPFLVSSPSDFMSIANGLDKHYKITSTIDMTGYEIVPFGHFKGTIVGNGIVCGINISKPKVVDNCDYYGLFTKISGEIDSVRFEGEISVNANNTSKIGLLAGEIMSDAKLSNVSVLVKNAQIYCNVKQEIYFGSIAGINAGEIQTEIKRGKTNFNLFNLEKSNIYCQSDFDTTKYYFGGAFGQNSGKITKIVTDNINLYNESNYIGIVNMNFGSLYASIQFAIGSIAGLNEGEIISKANNITPENYIKVSGSIVLNAQASNILGGIVGLNTGNIENCISRVKLRSLSNSQFNGYLGGLVGRNDNGTVQNCILQNVDDAKSLGNELSLIFAKSGISTENEINKNIDVFGIGIADKTTLQKQTYIERDMVEPNVEASKTNYYGDFLIVVDKDDNFIQEKFDIKKSENLVSHKASFESGFNKAMIMSSDGDEFVVKLDFFKAKNADEQDLLDVDGYNLQNLPFDVQGEVTVESSDTNIISITNDGKLLINNEGIVKLYIYSNLNRFAVKTVYVYVTVKTSSFALYTSSSQNFESLITNGKQINIKTSSSAVLSTEFLSDDVVLGGYPVRVESSSLNLFDNSTTEVGDRHYEFLKNGNIYYLRAVNDSGVNQVGINSKYSVIINQKVYSTDNLFENDLIFIVNHIKGAQSFSALINQFEIEPDDKFDYYVEVKTDDFSQKLENGSYKYGSNDLGNYFETIKTNAIYNISLSDEYQLGTEPFALKISHNGAIKTLYVYSNGSKIFVSEQNDLTDIENYYDNFNININNLFAGANVNDFDVEFETEANIYKVLKLNKITYYFSSKFILSENEYDGTYFIGFKSQQPTDASSFDYEIEVDVKKQSLKSLVVESFEMFDDEGNLLIGKGESSNQYLSPNSPNYLKINLTPQNADYDKVIVEWSSDNEDLDVLLSKINKNGKLENTTIYENAVEVLKSEIEDDCLLVKYDASTLSAVNGNKIYFKVSVMKGDEVIYTAPKEITIKFTVAVRFNIVGKENQDTIYLVKGKTYDFELISTGYAENEITMQSDMNILDLNVTNRTITVSNSDFLYPANQEGIVANINIFGSKIVDNITSHSVPFNQKVVIVDLALNSQGEIIKNIYANTANVAIGNTFNLDVELLNNVNAEFENLETPLYKKADFELDVRQNAIWEYQLGSLNVDGTYSYSENGWKQITDEGVSAVDSNGYFIISGNSQKGYVFSPIKIHLIDSQTNILDNVTNVAYKLRLKYGFEYNQGTMLYKEYDNSQEAYFNRIDLFSVNVYQYSSIDAPTPIETYQDILNMEENVFYILTNDIVLPSSFKPITTKIAGLDGNDHKIIFGSNFDYDGNKFGLFETISSNTIVRNLNIETNSNVKVSISNLQDNVYFGLLAGENQGVITNCSVKDLNEVKVSFAKTGSSQYVAGLVGINKGTITNSRVQISLNSSCNIAGFVGYNEGKIASCYVSNSLIVNTTSQSDNKTAGFVVYNATNDTGKGKIINSYVSGKTYGGTMYSSDPSKVIRSSTVASGFIFENNGLIENSYSDIPIQSSSKNSGFVYVNSGKILNSYSTSMLRSYSPETSFGFVYDNSQGKLNQCFYLSDEEAQIKINVSTNTSNENIAGLKKLSITDFEKPETFATFNFSKDDDVLKGVWFIPSKNAYEDFNNETKIFVPGRPELVSANLIVESRQEIDLENTKIDSVTGEVKYVYKNVGEYAQGSKYNPYVIFSASEFENRVLATNTKDMNFNHFRIVSDLDYEKEQIFYSKLFKTTILGDIEGNGMEIKNFVIDSTEKLGSAGLFAKIGNGSLQQGSVKNIILVPKLINLPNTYVVGVLAGTLDSGYISNVEVKGTQTSGVPVVVLGRNIVGGILGRATGTYTLFNISSSLSANASYRSEVTLGKKDEANTNLIYSYFFNNTHSISTMTNVSYSGCLVGVLAGKGNVSYPQVSGSVASLGEFAGLMFGGIGDGVSVENIDLCLVQGQFVQPAQFGGIVAGECYGYIHNANVYSNAPVEIFKTIPFTPKAVGGIVGLLGESGNLPLLARMSKNSSENIGLDNVNVSVDIINSNIETVGGIAGVMVGSKITDSTFEGDISSKITAGGIVGSVTSANNKKLEIQFGLFKLSDVFGLEKIILNNVNYNNGTIEVINDDIGVVQIGGLVGKVETTNLEKLIIESSKVENVILKSKTDIYGTSFNVNIGGLVGLVSGVKNLNINCSSNVLFDVELRDMKDCQFENYHVVCSYTVATKTAENKEGEFNLEKVHGTFDYKEYKTNVNTSRKQDENFFKLTVYKKDESKYNTANGYDDSEGNHHVLWRLNEHGHLTDGDFYCAYGA